MRSTSSAPSSSASPPAAGSEPARAGSCEGWAGGAVGDPWLVHAPTSANETTRIASCVRRRGFVRIRCPSHHRGVDACLPEPGMKLVQTGHSAQGKRSARSGLRDRTSTLSGTDLSTELVSLAFLEHDVVSAPLGACRFTEGTTLGADQLTFEDFFREQEARLYRSLCMITGSREEAEEITQEAFLKVWERWDRVSEMESPSGFLFTVAMNMFRSRYRSAMRAIKRGMSAAEPDDAFAVIEDRDLVFRGLKQLIPQQRAAVVLTSLLGFTSEEVGEMLGIKAATVRTLTSRARSAMKETVGEHP